MPKPRLIDWVLACVIVLGLLILLAIVDPPQFD